MSTTPSSGSALSTGVAAKGTLQFFDSNIENLDISDVDGVDDWHERFQQYCLTNPLIDSSNMTAHYITKIGKAGYRLLKDLAYPDKVSTKDVKDLQKLLLAHLQPTNFQAAERERFHNLVQKSGESLRSFVLKVQQQAAKCNFGSSLTEQMRDRLVAGVADQEIKRKLLKEPALTFKTAKEILTNWNDIDIVLHPPPAEVLLNKYF